MQSHSPVLHLKNKGDSKSFMEINIAEYLRLGMLEANSKEFSIQEYFDRQDQYSIVIYLNQKQNQWLWIKLVINGWVVNNMDIVFP